MTNRELKNQVHTIIDPKLERNEHIDSELIVAEVIRSYSAIYGADLPYYLLCAHDHTYRIVTSIYQKYGSLEQLVEDSKQPLLPGYEFLRSHYSFVRGGRNTLVPINDLVKEEIRSRVDQYRENSTGLSAHADELERYGRLRFPDYDEAVLQTDSPL